MGRETWTLALNMVIAVVCVPIGVELFTKLGDALFGTALKQIHPWIAFIYAYIPILLLLWIFLKATLDPLEQFGFKWSKQYLYASLGIGAISGIIMFFVSNATNAWADFGYASNPSLTLTVGFLLTMGIIIPFTEEILFRGIIQTLFTQNLMGGTWFHPAILIASGYEVLFHIFVPYYQAVPGQELAAIVQALPQAAYVLVFGFIGGVVYHRTKSLTGPFIIHALGNGLELVLFWLLV